MQLSIIVPVYNEEESIPHLYDRLVPPLERKGLEFEVILVNDGSRDSSGRLLDELADRDERIKVVHLRRNYGQTAGMMAGFRHASGKVIVAMDGDLQNDPEDIPRLLEKLDEGYDVVSGWRRDRKDATFSRTLPSRLANALISYVSRVDLHDYGCTLKAYRYEVLRDVRLYGEMHRFIPIHAVWEGARVAEIEVQHHPRRFGQSKYNLSRVQRVLLDLILIRFMDKALDRPIQYFGRIGLNTLFFAFLVGLVAIYLRLFEHVAFIQTPLPLLVALLMLSGLMFLSFGLVAELLMRVYFEAKSGGVSYSVARTRNLDATQATE